MSTFWIYFGSFMLFAFGIIFALLGIPLLKGQNAPEALISVVGTMFLSIGTMVYYTVVLENKYRKK